MISLDWPKALKSVPGEGNGEPVATTRGDHAVHFLGARWRDDVGE